MTWLSVVPRQLSTEKTFGGHRVYESCWKAGKSDANSNVPLTERYVNLPKGSNGRASQPSGGRRNTVDRTSLLTGLKCSEMANLFSMSLLRIVTL